MFVVVGPLGVWLGEEAGYDEDGLDSQHATVASMAACGLFVAAVRAGTSARYRWRGHATNVTNDKEPDMEIEKGLVQAC